jgi:hypothetical protein
MKESTLKKRWQLFIGQAKRRGATEEELKILVKAYDLIGKYLPARNKES